MGFAYKLKNTPRSAGCFCMRCECPDGVWLVGDSGLDFADDGGGVVDLDDDLVGDLSAMDFYISWEVESDAYAFAFYGCDAHDTDGVLWVADDDFFAFSSCDNQHPMLQTSELPSLAGVTEYITAEAVGNGKSRNSCVVHELQCC